MRSQDSDLILKRILYKLFHIEESLEANAHDIQIRSKQLSLVYVQSMENMRRHSMMSVQSKQGPAQQSYERRRKSRRPQRRWKPCR
jgi:structural maintenance of chromosome 1